MSEWSVSEQQSDNAGFTGFTLQWSFVIDILQVHVQFSVAVGQKYRYTVTGRFGPDSFRPWVFSAWVVLARVVLALGRFGQFWWVVSA